MPIFLPLSTIYSILPSLPIYTFTEVFGVKMGLLEKLFFDIEIPYFIGNSRNYRNLMELTKK